MENDTGEKDSSRKKVRLTEKLPTEKKVVEKRRSKETQSRQQEFRRRKTAEKVETDRRKIEKETGERTEERKDDLKKEYWRKVFSKMAEKRENSGLLKIKGVTKHIERIEKGRLQEGDSIVKEVSEKDRGEQSLKLEGNCEITGNIEERNNEIEVELRKEKVEEERKERKEKARRKEKEWWRVKQEKEKLVSETRQTPACPSIGLGEPRQNSTESEKYKNEESERIRNKKGEKIKISPGIMKIRQFFEKNEPEKIDKTDHEVNSVKLRRDTFEEMMDKKKRVEIQREYDRKEKMKKDRKLRRESKLESLRQIKSESGGTEWRGPLLKTGGTSQKMVKPSSSEVISLTGPLNVQKGEKILDNCSENSEGLIKMQPAWCLVKENFKIQSQKRKIGDSSTQNEIRGEEGGLQNRENYKKVKKDIGTEKFEGAKSKTETKRKKSIEKGTEFKNDGQGRETRFFAGKHIEIA